MTPLIVLAATLGVLGWVGSIVFLAIRRFDFMSNAVVGGWIALQIMGTSAPMFVLASVFRANDNLAFTFGGLAFLGPLFLVVNGAIWTYAIRRGLSSRATRGLPLPRGVDQARALEWGRRRGA